MELMRQIGACFAGYLGFILPAAATLVAVKYLLRVPHELFRKLLHLAAFLSTPVILHLAPGWQPAAATLVLFAAIVWPVLAWAEKFSFFAGLFEQRKPGEIKNSLLLLFLSNAALTAVCWGLLDTPWAASAAVLMWGFGDGAAALIGKPFGKHKVRLPLADRKKSWEGTGAMFAASLLAGLAYLAPVFGFGHTLLLALPASAVGAWVELISHGGYDTVTVAAADAGVLLSLYFLALR